MAYKKTTKDIVGSSVMLGVGGAALGQLSPMMPTGTGTNLINKTIGTSGRMMGAVIPASYGIGIIKDLNKKTRRK